jgi:molybdopterin-guanine dinucleotide biosynthesis protein MobB
MIPILSLVGKSDSGKTTLLEKLVKELRSMGYRVATVKHDAHSFEIDHKGKDSWRHKHAGANMTIISSPEKLALVMDTDHDHSLAELRERFVTGVDIIITEGYKRETHPRIEVFRKERSSELLCRDDPGLIAIAGDPPYPPEGVPVFGINDAEGISDFIERTLMARQA